MRRITLWVVATVAVVVLLFSYRTSTNRGGTANLPAIAAENSSGAIVSSPLPSTSSGGGKSGSSAPGTSGGSKTYQGSVAQTRWGPVQVTITVANGKITGVSVPTYPSGNGRDAEINAYALPILVQETMNAQSANIDTVSGATVTSGGYLQSLQSAIDAAHL